MASPPAEVDVDESVVRRLLKAEHPDLASLPLRLLDAGWDNILWRAGDDLVVRLPRRAAAADLIRHEQRWLPRIAGDLPLPVPVPVRVGHPSGAFPWWWSVVPWFPGVPGDRAELADPAATAAQLGSFLRALHRPAPPGAPANPGRGVDLGRRTATFDQRIRDLAGHVDAHRLRERWAAALAAAPHPGPPRWLHGDLHPANLVFRDGTLAAVVDFGDLCAGDPATDLAAAWLLLPAPAVAACLRAYGTVDADLRARAAGWAVLLALMLLEIGLDDKPTYQPVARRALDGLAGPVAP